MFPLRAMTIEGTLTGTLDEAEELLALALQDGVVEAAVARREMSKPEMPWQKVLMAALVRALEGLMGRNAGAARNRRLAAIRSDVERMLFMSRMSCCRG